MFRNLSFDSIYLCAEILSESEPSYKNLAPNRSLDSVSSFSFTGGQGRRKAEGLKMVEEGPEPVELERQVAGKVGLDEESVEEEAYTPWNGEHLYRQRQPEVPRTGLGRARSKSIEEPGVP